MSISLLTISIPSSNDLWLNVESNHSVLSWYTSMSERRRKTMKNMKKGNKPKKSMFEVNQDVKNYEKKWRRMFFDFCEKNYTSDDDIAYRRENIFSLFKK